MLVLEMSPPNRSRVFPLVRLVAFRTFEARVGAAGGSGGIGRVVGREKVVGVDIDLSGGRSGFLARGLLARRGGAGGGGLGGEGDGSRGVLRWGVIGEIVAGRTCELVVVVHGKEVTRGGRDGGEVRPRRRGWVVLKRRRGRVPVRKVMIWRFESRVRQGRLRDKRDGERVRDDARAVHRRGWRTRGKEKEGGRSGRDLSDNETN